QTEAALRQTLGADLDDRIGALDLDLTEKPETSANPSLIDVREALSQALKNRAEIQAQNQQLTIDDINVRRAGNNLKPRLDLTATFTTNGLGGVVFDQGTNGNPVVVSTGGFTNSLSQLGSFNFPTYGMTLQLTLPIRSSSAQADLGVALVSKRR